MDRDKNGFVDSDEFHTITNTLFAHNPSFRKTDYGKFVVEADTNQDGKVSIEEAVVWFAKEGGRAWRFGEVGIMENLNIYESASNLFAWRFQIWEITV